MPDVTLSSDMDAFLVTANNTLARTALGVGSASNVTFGSLTTLGGVTTTTGTFSGVILTTDTTSATSATTGSIRTAGGIGAAGNIIGGAAVAGATTVGILGRGGLRASADGVFQLRNVLNTQDGSLSISALNLSKTITPPGTTGAQTINNATGSVNFAASATSLVLTSSMLTTSSIVCLTVASNDTNMKSASYTPGTGSITIRGNAAPAAECRVDFSISN